MWAERVGEDRRGYVANTPWTANKGVVLPHVREAMASRGTSLIESMRHGDELPQSVEYRAGTKGFITN
jgi:hypothetical protein